MLNTYSKYSKYNFIIIRIELFFNNNFHILSDLYILNSNHIKSEYIILRITIATSSET